MPRNPKSGPEPIALTDPGERGFSNTGIFPFSVFI